MFILRKFFSFCISSQCMKYWINFESVHTFTYQKTLPHTLFFDFKIAINLWCIFKGLMSGNYDFIFWATNFISKKNGRNVFESRFLKCEYFIAPIPNQDFKLEVTLLQSWKYVCRLRSVFIVQFHSPSVKYYFGCTLFLMPWCQDRRHAIQHDKGALDSMQTASQ